MHGSLLLFTIRPVVTLVSLLHVEPSSIHIAVNQTTQDSRAISPFNCTWTINQCHSNSHPSSTRIGTTVCLLHFFSMRCPPRGSSRLGSSIDQTSSNMPCRVTHNAMHTGSHTMPIRTTCTISPFNCTCTDRTSDSTISIACSSSLPCQLHTSTITISMPGRLSLDQDQTPNVAVFIVVGGRIP